MNGEVGERGNCHLWPELKIFIALERRNQRDS